MGIDRCGYQRDAIIEGVEIKFKMKPASKKKTKNKQLQSDTLTGSSKLKTLQNKMSTRTGNKCVCCEVMRGKSLCTDMIDL